MTSERSHIHSFCKYKYSFIILQTFAYERNRTDKILTSWCQKYYSN